VALKHGPEKWIPVFGKRSCSSNKLERGDESKKSHPVPPRGLSCPARVTSELKLRSLAIFAFVLGAAISLGSLAAYAQAQERLVFAHYMVCCPRALISPAGTATGVATVDDFLEDIQEAHRAGIDGFALNCGAWRAYARYPEYVAQLFEAARRFGPQFKLFFSADAISADEAADMVVKYADHPNQFRYNGRPVLSSFTGSDQWARTVRAIVRERSGGDVFLVPYFFPPTMHETPSASDVSTLVGDSDDIDGFFYFGAAGAPDGLAAAIRLNADAWSKKGKLFMAGIAAYYRGLGVNYRVFENNGFEGLANQWKAAIETNTSWVELITWNDWGESYLSALTPDAESSRWTEPWGHLVTHQGYLEANRYFIDWFKAGHPPAIEQERLFYAYRLHSKYTPGRPAPGKPDTTLPRGIWSLVDRVHILAFLRKPADLTVQIGSHSELLALSAGMNQMSVPMRNGAVTFELRRDGDLIGSKTGEFPISAGDTWANFNTLAGEVPLGAAHTTMPGDRVR
jgi:glucan endo-1,3-alpha-glucosidase